MTLVDALAALQEGAVPTNEQTIAFLARVERSLPAKDGLSSSGSRLVTSSRRVLETTRELVAQRNTGEEVQEFLWRTRGTAAKAKKDGGLKFKWGKGAEAKAAAKGKEDVAAAAAKQSSGTKSKLTNAGKTVKSDTVQAGKHLRTLARLVLIQPELRHILADLGYVFAEVVDKTAGASIADARGQLGQMRSATGTLQSLAQNAFQHKQQNGGGIAQQINAVAVAAAAAPSDKPSPLPNLAALRAQLSAALKDGQISMDAIRTELKNGKTVPVLDELRRQALASASAVSTSKEQLARMQAQIGEGKIPPEVLQALQIEQQKEELEEDQQPIEGKLTNGDAAPVPPTEAPLTATDLLDALQMLAVANAKVRMAPKKAAIKQMLHTTRKEAQANIHDAFDDEVKQRLLRRSRKLVVDCQTSTQYKEAIVWFIERVEALFSVVNKHAQRPSTSLDEALSHNVEPLIQLVENFAGGEPVRPLLEIARQLSLGAKDDPQIQAFWSDVDKHVRKCLLEEGFIMLPDAEEGWQELLQRFKVLRQDYKDKVVKLLRGVSNVLNAVRHDELIIKLLKAFKSFLGAASKDGWKLSTLWHDLRHKILPPLFEKFGVIPVPRIKYLHPDFDLVIENIALQLKTLLPDTFDVRVTNDMHLDFRRMADSTHAHQFKIKLKGMSLRVYKLAFALTTKMGFRFHDKGIADLWIKNFGVSMYIDVPKDPGPHYFVVRKVKAKLGGLHLKVHESNHRVMHFMADKLANSYLTKRIIRHFIAQGITLGLKQLDVQLMTMRLGRDGKRGDIKLEDVRRQMAELRDLLRKYHEQAGTLEIDFTRDDSISKTMTLSDRAKAVGKQIDDSHAVRWVKKQVEETGKKEIVRDEWRSNAFDAEGVESVVADRHARKGSEEKEAEEAADEQNVAATIDDDVQESAAAAIVRSKPEGPTTDATVDKAERELEKAEQEEKEPRADVQKPKGMESEAGKAIVGASDDRAEQAQALEKIVDQQHGDSST